jgi:hypothetical protein
MIRERPLTPAVARERIDVGATANEMLRIDFAEAGEFLLQNGARRFGRHIALGESRAASGDDERATDVVRQVTQGRFNFSHVIGKNSGDEFNRLCPNAGENTLDLRPARILVDASRCAVAAGDAAHFHFLIFSTTLISEITIFLSTALHMS